MVWPLIAMAAISVLGDSQERNAQYKAQIAQNKAIREANLENTQRVGFKVGLLNVQRGERLRQLAQRKSELGQAELQELSAAGNNAAASGTVGASVDAVQTDIALQFERARTGIQIENEIEAVNFNTALYELFQGGRDQLIKAVKPEGASDAAIVGKAVVSAAGSYFGGQMNLGLGQQTTTQQPLVGRLSSGPSTRGGARNPTAVSFRG